MTFQEAEATHQLSKEDYEELVKAHDKMFQIVNKYGRKLNTGYTLTLNELHDKVWDLKHLLKTVSHR